MDETWLEIRDYHGEGYKPLIDFACWRVAYLRYIDDMHPAAIARMERHMETDEVFVLLNGRAVLFLGEGERQVERVSPLVMETGKLYNVKRNAWHTVVVSRDATILLVENNDTCDANTQFSPLTAAQQLLIQETARRKQPEWW
jgi:ureidoglycolate hydrolase